MAVTTYDTIYEAFLNIAKTDDFNLPQTQDKIYPFIKVAVMKYNNRMRDNLSCNDNLEIVDKELNDDSLLVLIHFMKLVFVENELTYFVTIFNPFIKELGIKDYNSQKQGKEALIKQVEYEIDDILKNMETDYM